LSTLVRRAALAAALVTASTACAPVAEPIVAPLPTGAALDTAGRPALAPAMTTDLDIGHAAAVRRGTRSESGAPGPRYWQNRVRYSIQARVDPRRPQLEGTERIVYHNASPDSLPFIVFNFYQNLFRGGALNTGGLMVTRLAAQGTTLGELARPDYEANLREGRKVPGYVVQGTLARVILPRAVQAGDSVVFEVAWNYRVPGSTAPRTGFEDALGGRVLQIAQWYPQIAVYDDVVGMDVTPYQGQGEFYLDYGEWDVELTLPTGWLVMATGELQNPEQALSPTVRQRLAVAMQTDSVVRVVTRDELGRGTAEGTGGQVTWKFRARDVRDFAFAASDRYLWDATRATIPTAGGGTRNIPVHAMYRPGAPGWEQAAHYGDHSTEFLSRAVVPYVYPQISVSEGPIYGMEYPMLVFIGKPDEDEQLYEVIAHEVGHEWVPMMVGQDEAAYAWMDEGINTYMEALAYNDFFSGRQPDHFIEPRNYYFQLVAQASKQEAPLMRHADAVANDFAYGVAAYYKPGTLMRSLRAALGDEVFTRGFRTYLNEWHLKHPYAHDFFNTMERVSGKDLDWFWNPFFYRTATFDQGISTVTQAGNEVRITVRDFGQAPGPTFVTVTTASGAVQSTIPVERWLSPSTRVQNLTVQVNGPVTRVELDPQQFFPDVNRRNNVWTP
jgi:hypothetical protein